MSLLVHVTFLSYKNSSFFTQRFFNIFGYFSPWCGAAWFSARARMYVCVRRTDSMHFLFRLANFWNSPTRKRKGQFDNAHGWGFSMACFTRLRLLSLDFKGSDDSAGSFHQLQWWFGDFAMGPFNNYVDKILTFFDYLPTSTWTFITLKVDKKKHFLTIYPPHLVHVVFERPL